MASKKQNQAAAQTEQQQTETVTEQQQTEQQESQQSTEQQTQQDSTGETGATSNDLVGETLAEDQTLVDSADHGKEPESSGEQSEQQATQEQSGEAAKTLDIQLDANDKDPEGTVAAITQAAQQMAGGESLEVKTTEGVENQNATDTGASTEQPVDALVAQVKAVGVSFRQKMALNKSYNASDAVSCATQLCVAIDALLREQNLERFSNAWVALVEEFKLGRKTVFSETAVYRGWRERNFMHNTPEKARKYQHLIALLTSTADIGVLETQAVFDVRGLVNRLGLSETASRNLLALYRL
jgi:hypothetical protein